MTALVASASLAKVTAAVFQHGLPFGASAARLALVDRQQPELLVTLNEVGIPESVGAGWEALLLAAARRAQSPCSLRRPPPGTGTPHAAVGVLGGTAIVDLAVAVTYNDPVHEVARDIQRQVTATLRDQVGLRSVTVNVTVDDILGDDER